MTNPADPFEPAWWLRSPHLQTLWGKLARRRIPLRARVERWETPDGDFVEVHRAEPPQERNAPRLLMLHGLEGTPRSHYVGGMFAEARRRAWGADLLVFRGCGTELNRTRRFYHSGETGDLDFVVRRVVEEYPGRPLVLAGVSLGGNVLLKWLGELGADVPAEVRGAAGVSVPYDLARGSRHLQHGFARMYDRHFVRSLLRKVRRKRAAAHPDLPGEETLAGVQTLWDFDDVVTAPVHGFRDAEDYYARSSALGYLARIRVPTLLVSAADDPFLPRAVLDEVRAAVRDNPALTLDFPAHGGHVGFVGGAPWSPEYWAERRVSDFLAAQLAP